MLKPTPLFPGRGCRRRSADILRRRDFEDLREVPDEYTPDELRDAHNDLVKRLLPRWVVLSLTALAQACLFADGLTVVTSRLGGLSSKSNVVTSVMWDGDDPVGPSGAREIVDSSFAGGTQAVNRVTGAFDGVSARVRGLESRTNEWNKVGDKADVSRVEFIEGRTNVWNSALHEETDPTVPSWAKQENPPAVDAYTKEQTDAMLANKLSFTDEGGMTVINGPIKAQDVFDSHGNYLSQMFLKANRAETGDADEIATLDADGNPTRSGIAKTSVATKTDLEGYLPLTGGDLTGNLYGFGASLGDGSLYLGNGMIYPYADPRSSFGPPMIANTGSGFILYHSDDIPGNPTWHYGQTPAADNEIAVKGDLDDYLPLTGGELSGGVYAQQAIASATTVGAQTIDAWADIRLGSETYYLHNENECLADANGKFAHETMISATDPTFSNAVLAVGLNIDTNSVAVLNEIASTFGGFPLGAGETATTVGGLLAALAAAVAWLKKNKVGSFESVGGATATVDNGVAKLDDFFTKSNSLLTSRVNTLIDAKVGNVNAVLAAALDGTEVA